jgi:hypothetical protein
MKKTSCLVENESIGLVGENDQTRQVVSDLSDKPMLSAKVVVVLGMHRSGTSLLAGLLTLLGIDLGENLLEADVNNQAGYWEQQEIYKTQDALLQKLRRHWIGPAGTIPFVSNWWKLSEIQPFKKRLIEIVQVEVKKAKGIWGFKDPRTSRLLPMWKEIFAELELEPLYLLSVRDPTAVVESIVKRDEISISRAEMLWLLHNLDAVRDTGRQLRAVVNYDRWFTHLREQARAVAHALNLVWPEDESQLLTSLQNHIRPDLRHCRTKGKYSVPFMAETYAALEKAAVTGQISDDLRQLDREVQRAIALCKPWAGIVEELTCPPTEVEFSFIDHFADGQLESLSYTAQVAIWNARLDGTTHRTIMLHPHASLKFHLPVGACGKVITAVTIHPDAWEKSEAGGCEFHVQANGRLAYVVAIDPVRLTTDRRWHEIQLEIPENPAGFHEITFETKSIGSPAFRWALWRAPRFVWIVAPKKQTRQSHDHT